MNLLFLYMKGEVTMYCCNNDYHEFPLDWFLEQIKNALSEWENMKISFEELKKYVQDYFLQLNITEEIKKQLKELIDSGKLDTLITEVWTGYLKGKIGLVNPMNYGAVGDGVHDDTQAIIKASKDGALFNSKNTFKVSGVFTISGNVEGISLECANDTEITCQGYVKNSNFSMKGKETVGRGNWVLVFRNKSNSYVSNCIFKGCNNAIYLDKCENFAVSGCVFNELYQTDSESGNGYGILTVNCKNIRITENIFKDVDRHSIYVSIDNSDPGYNENIIIENNQFVNRKTFGQKTGFENPIFCRTPKEIYIRNNIFDGTLGAINVRAYNVNTNVKHTELCCVENNTFVNVDNKPRNLSDACIIIGKELGALFDRSIIKNNTLTTAKNNFCKLQGCENIEVFNNIYTSGEGTTFLYFSDEEHKKSSVRGNKVVSGYFLYCTVAPSEEIEVINNIINCDYIMSGESKTKLFKLLYNNVKVTSNRQDAINIDKIVAYANYGDDIILIRNATIKKIVSDLKGNIAFFETDIDFSKVVDNTNPAFGYGGIPSDAFLFKKYTSVSELPTENVILNSRAMTADNKVYVFNGSAWIALN